MYFFSIWQWHKGRKKIWHLSFKNNQYCPGKGLIDELGQLTIHYWHVWHSTHQISCWLMPHAVLEGFHTKRLGTGRVVPAQITPNGGLCLNSDERLLCAFSAVKELKTWTLSSLLARRDEWRLSLFKASSPSEEILDSARKGKQFFIWEPLSIVQSSIHNKDFLIETESEAHSCPAHALYGCSGGTGVLWRTPERRGGNISVVGEQSKHWWSRATPPSCGLQGGARTVESHRPSAHGAVQPPSSPGKAAVS